MKDKKVLKRLLAGALAAAVTVSAVVIPASAEDGVRIKLKEVSDGISAVIPADKIAEAEDAYADDDVVRVSIFLNDASTIKAGFDISTIATDSKAIAYRDNLKAKQEIVEKNIEKATSEELDVVHNLTLAANVISANVKYGQIKAIEKISGVKSVVIENQYEAAKTVENLANDPNMSTSTNMIGSNVTWAEGYTGAGSKVAVIDTGIDKEHQSFSAEAYLYSLSLIAEEKGMTLDEYKATLNLLDAAYIESVKDQLNFAIDVDKVFVSEKIPFAFNYVDENYDITHENDTQGEHGSHVEGIAAANRYIKDAEGKFVSAIDTVKVQGVAPDAQIITMKVFGKGGGAYDSDYMLAIEDAIVLGADSVNLSLGSGMGGNSKHSNAAYQQILTDIAKSGTVVAMSAGNAGHWADSAYTQGYLYADDVNTQTDGSPGSYTNAFTVASADNIGMCGEYFTVDGTPVIYTQTSYTNKPLATLAGEQEYVFIDGNGTAEDWAAVGDALKGKIAVCSRGAISFYQKGEFAVEAGAIATIVYNNAAGSINMDLSDYTKDAPFISITQAEGALLKANATASEDGTYYTGTINIEAGVNSAIINDGYVEISSFSSWGVPGSLELKPEITAPGGNIYSVNGLHVENGAVAGGHDKYENMSGTSMASPQVAGMAALAGQYIRENGLEEKTGLKARTLAQSLLMSTAEPMFEDLGEDGVYYYPVFRQGAGLANIGNVVKAESYILMDNDANAGAADGKVKVELGDDPDKKGVYTFGFTIYNLTESAKAYTLSADMFSQYVFADKDGNLYMDTATEYLNSDAEFDCGQVAVVPANGKIHVTATITLSDEDKEFLAYFENGAYIEGYVYASPYMMYDFDGDGDVDTDDGQMLLDYRTGVKEEKDLYNKEYADMDGDGDIDTYDAYLFLDLLATGKLHIVEGEGIVGTTHSIPVLGFYGNWSTPSMFDKGSYIDYNLAGTEDRIPYLAADLGSSSFNSNAFGVTYPNEDGPYYLGGNIMVKDTFYDADRASVNNTNGTYLSLVNYAAIRNASGSKFTVVNETTGETVFETFPGSVTAAYYYVNGGYWNNTGHSYKPNYKFTGAKEGDKLNISFALAPEYYLDAEGNIRWEDVDTTNAHSISVTIDNTAPTIEEAILKGSTLSVSASDNRYIAAVALTNKAGTKIYAASGSQKDAKPGEIGKFEIDVTGINADQVYLQVYDYALNVTTYEIEGTFGEGTILPPAVTFDPTLGVWYELSEDGTEAAEYDYSNYTFTAATVVDHIVYAFDEQGVLYTMPEKDLSDTTRVSSISAWLGQEVMVYDMAYNPADDTIYALVNGMYIISIDRLTGVPTGLDYAPFTTTTLAIDAEGNFYSNMLGVADVYTYTLDTDPELVCEIGKATGATYDYDPVAGLQSMAYDPNTGKIGWNLVESFSIFGMNFDITTFFSIDPVEGTYDEGGEYFGNLFTSLIYFDKTTESKTPEWAAPTNTVADVVISVLDPDNNTLLKDSTLQLTADVLPWTVTNRDVTWTSSDTSVATVDANGLVTAVGLGEAEIIAVSKADPTKGDIISVTVEALDITVNGALQDVDGSPLTFTWDMSKGDSWIKEFDLPVTIESATVNDKNGNLYIMDSTEDVWGIYEVDSKDGTVINSFGNAVEVPLTDIAYSNKFSTADTNKITGIYAYYFVAPQDVSALTGAAFNLSSRIDSYAVAIANMGEEKIEYQGDVYDTEKYAILDNAGTLLIYNVYATDSGYSALLSIFSTGIKETYPGFSDYNLTASMVLGDDGILYLSAFNGESNNLYQIFVDEEEGTCSSRYIGNAGADVWPVVLTSVTVNAPASGNNAASGSSSRVDMPHLEKAPALAAANMVKVEAEQINVDEVRAAVAEKATLVDAAEDVATDPSEEGNGDTSAKVEGDKLTVTIVPKDDEGNNVDTTNGLFRVTYDSEKLTLVSADVNADYESVNDAVTGKLVIGYVNPVEALAAGDKAVELVFTVKEGAELDGDSIVVDHAEVIDINYDKVNEENGEITEDKFLEEKPLAEDEPTPDDSTEPDVSEPETTTGEGTNNPDDDNNKPTGIVIAFVPAVVSAAAVMVAKKRNKRK